MAKTATKSTSKPKASAPATASGLSIKDETAILVALREASLAGEPKLAQGKGGLYAAGAAGKKLLELAEQKGWLKLEIQTIPGKGKSKTAKTIVLAQITDAGRKFLLAQDSPKPLLEAIQSRLENLQALQSSLEKQLAEKTEQLRAEFVTRLEELVGPVRQVETEIQNALKFLTEILGKIETPTATVPIMEGTRVEGNSGGQSAQTPPAEHKMATEEISQEDLRDALEKAYEELCNYKEFQNRLVEIPRLFIEVTNTTLPHLSVKRFHEELKALKEEFKVELHELNEVHEAENKKYAIIEDERLYYYVIWR